MLELTWVCMGGGFLCLPDGDDGGVRGVLRERERRCESCLNALGRVHLLRLRNFLPEVGRHPGDPPADSCKALRAALLACDELVQDAHGGGLLLVACRPLHEQGDRNSDVYLHRETIARVFFEAFRLLADSPDVRVYQFPCNPKPP